MAVRLCQDDPVLVSWLEPFIWAFLMGSLTCSLSVILYTWFLAWWTEKHMGDLDEVIVIVEDDDEDEYDNEGEHKMRSRPSIAEMYEDIPEEYVIKSHKTDRRRSTFGQMDVLDEESSSMEEQDTSEEENTYAGSEIESSVRSSVSMHSVSTKDGRGNSIEIAVTNEHGQKLENTDVEECDSRGESAETLGEQSLDNSEEVSIDTIKDSDQKDTNGKESEGNEERPVHSLQRRRYRQRNADSNDSRTFRSQNSLPVKEGAKLQRTSSQNAAHHILELMVNPGGFKDQEVSQEAPREPSPKSRRISLDIFTSGHMFTGKPRLSPRSSPSPKSNLSIPEKNERSDSDHGISENSGDLNVPIDENKRRSSDRNLRNPKVDKKFDTVKATSSQSKPSVQFFNFNSLPRKSYGMTAASTSSTPAANERARKESTESHIGGRAVPRGQSKNERSGSLGYNSHRRTAVTFDQVVDVADV